MKVRRSCCDEERPSRLATWAIAAGAIAVTGILLTATAAEMNDEGTGAEEFEVAGEQATGTVCAAGCHGWEAMFEGPRQVPRQWDFIISEMVGLGAYGTDEQLDLVSRYLSRMWGLVRINSASTHDLVVVLALPEEDADAVIAYREEHGQFADLESLKKVPGIDADTIDAQAAAITFN